MIETLIPALLPAAADGIRGLISKLTGGAGAKPQNVEETVTLMSADTDRLRALAEIDKPTGNVSVWVNNIRALQRPAATALVIMGYLVAVTMSAPEHVQLQLGNYASMVTFYLFGDRSYMYFKQGAK